MRTVLFGGGVEMTGVLGEREKRVCRQAQMH